MKRIRKILWRILGFDYQSMLNKTDFVLLKNDGHKQIGKHTYDNGAKVWRWTSAPLVIGNYCSIANDVNFIVDEGFHSAAKLTNYPLINNLFTNDELVHDNITKSIFLKGVDQKSGITIGNDVWIGMGAYIMPGVTVGNGVTIAANSVVTKDIPDYALVAGSPAKVIREKLPIEDAKQMNAIAWWDWEVAKVKSEITDFYKLNASEFIAKHKIN